MKKLFLIACIVLLTMSANAQTDNYTDMPQTFDTEEQFIEHLITEAVDLYSPRKTVDVKWRRLVYNQELSLTLGFNDTTVKICAPFGVFDNQYNGALLNLEYKF